MLRFTFAIIALVGLAACETTQGLGRDIQDAGQVIESEVE